MSESIKPPTELEYLIRERAAILEFEAGLPREQADSRAMAEVIRRWAKEQKALSSEHDTPMATRAPRS